MTEQELLALDEAQLPAGYAAQRVLLEVADAINTQIDAGFRVQRAIMRALNTLAKIPPPDPVMTRLQARPPIPEKPSKATGDMTEREICGLLHVSRDTLWRWVQIKKFPAPRRVGRNKRWPRAVVERWRATRPTS